MKFLSILMMVVLSVFYAGAQDSKGGAAANKKGAEVKTSKGGKAAVSKKGAEVKTSKGKGVEADKNGVRTTPKK